jgi:hypothetical protein
MLLRLLHGLERSRILQTAFVYLTPEIRLGDMTMEKRKSCRIVFGLAVIGSLLPVAGCFIWNSDVSYGDKGAPLSGTTLKQIECGTTTKAWLLATLGEPSEQSTTDTGDELLKYKYSKNQESNVVMPFVIVNDEKKNQQTVYFQVKDDIVQKYWVETVKR